MGRSAQRGHEPANARRACGSGMGGMDGALAHPGGLRRGLPALRSCALGASSAIPAARCACGSARRRLVRPRFQATSPSCWPCPASASTPRGPWRASITGATCRWWTPTCVASTPAPWMGSSSSRNRPRRSWRRWRHSLPAVNGPRFSAALMELGALVHCEVAEVRGVPAAHGLRVATGGLPAAQRGGARARKEAHTEVQGNRPPSARAHPRRAARGIGAGAAKFHRRGVARCSAAFQGFGIAA